MKKELRIREGETLGDWIERLASAYVGCEVYEQMKDMLHEVSVTSYAEGSNAAVAIMNRQHDDGWRQTKIVKPEQGKRVVGFWKKKKVMLPCYYQDGEWYEANPDKAGVPLKAPSLWKEKEV